MCFLRILSLIYTSCAAAVSSTACRSFPAAPPSTIIVITWAEAMAHYSLSQLGLSKLCRSPAIFPSRPFKAVLCSNDAPVSSVAVELALRIAHSSSCSWCCRLSASVAPEETEKASQSRKQPFPAYPTRCFHSPQEKKAAALSTTT